MRTKGRPGAKPTSRPGRLIFKMAERGRGKAWATRSSVGPLRLDCDPGHSVLRRAVLKCSLKQLHSRGFKMLNWRRRRGLRLEPDREAKRLISERGGEAYSVARRRAEEASSETMANDWSVVAFVIARQTRKAPHLLNVLPLALSRA